jgi:hypothetical protein
MGELELVGLVLRERSHGPYQLLFRQQVWNILQAAADLARDVSAEQARIDAERASELRKVGFRGNRRDRPEEQGG